MKLSRRNILPLLLLIAAGVGLSLFAFARFLQEDDNYSRIEDRLYLGGFVASPPRGTRAVLNLCEQEDPYRREFQLWERIPDSEPAPSLDWLRRMVEQIDAWQRQGITTYVHCFNGVSRSGFVVVAYEMHKNHWTRNEALQYVRSKRPLVRPHPALMERLLEWEREVHGSRTNR